ncbi:MAG: cytochrome c biogenesis protein CcsA [Gemmataceae bacterium]
MNLTPSRLLAWSFVAAVGLSVGAYLLMGLASRPEGDDAFHLQAFGRLPVVDHGRVKPIDTLARVSLMILSSKQEYTDADGKTRPAIEWLIDLMTASTRQTPTEKAPLPGESRLVKAYRVENEALRKQLGVADARDVVFSFQELYDAAGPEGLKKIFEEAAKLGRPDTAELTGRDKAVAELAAQMRAHLTFSSYETPHKVFRIDNDQLLALIGLEGRPGFRYAFGEFLPRLTELEREARRANKIRANERPPYEQQAFELFRRVELYVGLARGNADTLHLVAPTQAGGEWKVLTDATDELQGIDRKDPEALRAHTGAIAFRALLHTYSSGEKKEFNQVVDRYAKLVDEALPKEMATAVMESRFNAFAPFFQCAWMYVVVFLVACVSWLWRDRVINRFAFWMMLLTVLIHTTALVQRMLIQGRPPVTNLYSSAVFIGWAAVLICLVIEWKHRNAFATAVGGLTGFATLLIAHYLGGSGDTLEMMQAVLDTNFWLATHVTTVTIGYSATFVAGLFGIIFLWMMLVTTVLNSLRKGGRQSAGQAVLYAVAAVGLSLFAMTLVAGNLLGVLFLVNREAPRTAVLATLAVALVPGIGYAGYLVAARARQAAGELPAGARFLEAFALTENSRSVLMWMMYGTVCFATLFSFVGTVLGGIWADQSWGRFWGWDPKENGALLIVIMNALILHARWGGMVKDRGLALLTLVGNMVTMWSWFGTNQLGIGLHSYGFNNALVQMCTWFWISQLGLIVLGLLPFSDWRNYKPLPLIEEPTPREARPRVAGKRGVNIQPA